MLTSRARDRRFRNARVLTIVVLLSCLVPVLATCTSSSIVASDGSMQAPAGYTSEQKIFEDQFTGTSLDTTKWTTYLGAEGTRWDNFGKIAAPYSGPNTPLTNSYSMFGPSQVTVNNGLTLTAKRNNVVSTGTYPWISGVVTTEGKFTLPTSGWYVQVKAKLPDMTRGMWPGVWFLPARSGTAFNELDFIQGGETGAGPVNQVNAFDYFSPERQRQSTPNLGVDLTAGYHIWGLQWTPGVGIKAWLDGKLVWSLSASSSLTIPSEPYEIILDLDVAGGTASGSHTIYDATTPTSSMVVAEVQAYS